MILPPTPFCPMCPFLFHLIISNTQFGQSVILSIAIFFLLLIFDQLHFIQLLPTKLLSSKVLPNAISSTMLINASIEYALNIRKKWNAMIFRPFPFSLFRPIVQMTLRSSTLVGFILSIISYQAYDFSRIIPYFVLKITSTRPLFLKSFC